MKSSFRVPAVALLALSLSVASPAAAQAPATPDGYQQVVSANPFGLLLGWFNAEYERIVTPAVNIGFAF